MKSPLNYAFRDEYELVLRIGKKRFGSECKHEHTKNGKCLNCFRTVIDKQLTKKGRARRW